MQTRSLRRATSKGGKWNVSRRRKREEKETTNRERSRSVPGRGPAPSSIQSKPFIGNDLEEPTTPEGIGVRLALDLEDVERKENDLTDPNYTVIEAGRKLVRCLSSNGE